MKPIKAWMLVGHQDDADLRLPFSIYAKRFSVDLPCRFIRVTITPEAPKRLNPLDAKHVVNQQPNETKFVWKGRGP